MGSQPIPLAFLPYLRWRGGDHSALEVWRAGRVFEFVEPGPTPPSDTRGYEVVSPRAVPMFSGRTQVNGAPDSRSEQCARRQCACDPTPPPGSGKPSTHH